MHRLLANHEFRGEGGQLVGGKSGAIGDTRQGGFPEGLIVAARLHVYGHALDAVQIEQDTAGVTAVGVFLLGYTGLAEIALLGP